MDAESPSTRRRRVALLYGPEISTHDAILTFARRLAGSLQRHCDVDAVVLRRGGRGRWLRDDDQAGDRHLRFDAYVLQYNPFSFGRWGIAPWLPLAWRRLSTRGHPRMVLTVHEAHVPPIDWRNKAMGLGQRTQLKVLLGSSDAAIATCRERAEQLEALGTRLRVGQIPVGSNLPEFTDRSSRAKLRRDLAGPRARPIIATFGNAHPSRLLSHLQLALDTLAETMRELVVLNLGASPPRLLASSELVEIVTPGPIGAQELALYLSCADLVLLPFANGAITNKTTLMAALQAGLPVLSTRGPSTDDVLRDPGVRLVDVKDAGGYAAAAVTLMRDDREREALGRRGRALYERAFCWAVIAARTVEVLGFSGFEALDRDPIGVEVSLDHRVP